MIKEWDLQSAKLVTRSVLYRKEPRSPLAGVQNSSGKRLPASKRGGGRKANLCVEWLGE